MHELTTIFVSAEEGASHIVNELPIPAFFFGAITFVLLCALAIVTFAFRDVANRHGAKAAAYAREHGGQTHASESTDAADGTSSDRGEDAARES